MGDMMTASLFMLSDITLVETYHKAVGLGLDKEFILLLDKEIRRRGLEKRKVS